MNDPNNNANNDENNEKNHKRGFGFRLLGNPKLRKAVRIIRNNPKLIINAVYSFFICLILFGLRFYRFLVIADFGSGIRKARKSKLEIQKRLYLGGRYIGGTERELCLYEAFGKLNLSNTRESKVRPGRPGHT